MIKTPSSNSSVVNMVTSDKMRKLNSSNNTSASEVVQPKYILSAFATSITNPYLAMDLAGYLGG